MCTVLLPPGVNPIAVNKYINKENKENLRIADELVGIRTLLLPNTKLGLHRRTNYFTLILSVSFLLTSYFGVCFWNADKSEQSSLYAPCREKYGYAACLWERDGGYCVDVYWWEGHHKISDVLRKLFKIGSHFRTDAVISRVARMQPTYTLTSLEHAVRSGELFVSWLLIGGAEKSVWRREDQAYRLYWQFFVGKE